MFEAQDQILNQLRAGEDGVSEFNTLRFGRHGVVDPAAESMAGELVAFANAAGGALFLGIGDDGSIKGIPKSRHEAVETSPRRSSRRRNTAARRSSPRSWFTPSSSAAHWPNR